ncbi:MAG: PEGA domain-containing protein [Polyangiales bacterium]
MARSLALVLLASGAILGQPSTASAQASAGQATAAVLSVVSEEGDDDFATDLTSALRTAVDQLDAFKLDAREITLTQMMLAHGCSDADAVCLGKITATLGVGRVFFATAHRADAGTATYEVKVHIYNAETKIIERTVEDEIPIAESERDQLTERATRWVADLAGVRLTGTVHIRVNVPGAGVSIDDRPAGMTDSKGALQVQLGAGDHSVEITAKGYAPYQQDISIIANHEATQEVYLQPEGASPELGTPSDGSSSSLSWLGWSLVGLGVAGAAVGVTSAILISGLDGDQPFDRYRSMVPKGKDACTEADAGETYGLTGAELGDVKSTCSSASTYELLFWVGLAVGVVSTAAGIYILLTDDDDGSDADETALTVTPVFSSQRALLNASLSF